MRILLVVTAFNGLTQRVYEQLKQKNHQLSVVFANQEQELRKALTTFEPELILCPFLKQRIPESIWQKNLCIIIHPGIKGDRGPSSLDWAILNNEAEWGVTALQADSEMDAGDIWSSQNFPMRKASKASLYRQEVTQTAAKLVDDVIERFQMKGFKPEPLDYSKADVKGELLPLIRQPERAIDWNSDTSDTILAKICAADSFPGVLDELCSLPVYLYGACAEGSLTAEQPKQIIAQRDGAICISTIDGAIWVSHLKHKPSESKSNIKLPASWVLEDAISNVKENTLPLLPAYELNTYKEISYREKNGVGYIYFNFHNGAMGTEQCQRLLAAYNEALTKDTAVLVLMGGDDFFSNGIHLNHIQASADPAEESWKNINAIDDVVKAILETRNKITVAALRNNAGAGGAMMPLACDYVFARDGVVLNPHYKSMGLYGSEYWTYTLSRRVGQEKALQLTESCMPLGIQAAAELGMVDVVFPADQTAFLFDLEKHCEDLAADYQFAQLIENKNRQQDDGEFDKPLAHYRLEELANMKECFWGEHSSYHQKREDFVFKVCPCETPKRLRGKGRKTGEVDTVE